MAKSLKSEYEHLFIIQLRKLLRMLAKSFHVDYLNGDNAVHRML